MFLESVQEYYQLMIEILVIGVAIYICIFAIIFEIVSSLDRYFQGALQLLQRLSPYSLISNIPLFRYLFHPKSDKFVRNSSIYSTVIQNFTDAIFCLNINETIETVNPSVTSLLLYNPEQLLGQHISIVLPQEQSENISTQMSLMREGQSSLLFEDYSQALTEYGTLIPVHILLLEMTGNSESKPKSFVLILRDESQLQFQMKKAQEAKTQSEELLFSILPRDIVTKLNHGETDISFSVPCVCAVFVDIVQFSQYSV
jgi:PAS domain S-box-containing protein